MGAYLEVIILYIILFFWRSAVPGAPQDPSFSIISEITKILIFLIPSIILIWYFKHKHWNIKKWIRKPDKNDLFSGLIAYPCLLITGISMGIIAAITGNTQVPLQTPDSLQGWLILSLFCLFSAWFEEGFFRFYILSKKEELNLNNPAVLLLSTALFSFCHLYNYPFGFINAVISGFVLGILFLRFKTIYGITIAHGLYNLTAYILIALN